MRYTFKKDRESYTNYGDGARNYGESILKIYDKGVNVFSLYYDSNNPKVITGFGWPSALFEEPEILYAFLTIREYLRINNLEYNQLILEMAYNSHNTMLNEMFL